MFRLLAMSSRPAPHEVLGVAPEPDQDVVKRAYREIAKACHPDVTDDRWRHRLFRLARLAYDEYQERWAEEEAPPRIVQFVEENPGCTTSEVTKTRGLSDPWGPGFQRHDLRRAERKGWIENRGKPHRHAWYVSDDT